MECQRYRQANDSKPGTQLQPDDRYTQVSPVSRGFSSMQGFLKPRKECCDWWRWSTNGMPIAEGTTLIDGKERVTCTKTDACRCKSMSNMRTEAMRVIDVSDWVVFTYGKIGCRSKYDESLKFWEVREMCEIKKVYARSLRKPWLGRVRSGGRHLRWDAGHHQACMLISAMESHVGVLRT